MGVKRRFFLLVTFTLHEMPKLPINSKLKILNEANHLRSILSSLSFFLSSNFFARFCEVNVVTLSNALESFERLLPVDFRRILWDVHRYSETTSEIFVQTICHLGLDAAHQMESAFAINGGSPNRFDFRLDQENSFAPDWVCFQCFFDSSFKLTV